ncbi:MAG: Ig-like domain-containing protein [Treponema sp.]|nr:Ig-like domain-containing protein [Treponema sp.]
MKKIVKVKLLKTTILAALSATSLIFASCDTPVNELLPGAEPSTEIPDDNLVGDGNEAANSEEEDSESDEDTNTDSKKGSDSGKESDSKEKPAKNETYETLPFIPEGNQLAKIEGAGIWMYLDNTSLGITGANAGDIVASSTVTAVDSVDSSAVTINSFEFNDFSPDQSTVRLYALMPDAVHTTIDVTANIKIGQKLYKGTASFKNGAYQFDYTPTEIKLSANALEVKPGDNVTLSVKGTPYSLDISDKCTFSIESGDETSSSISGNILTAGKTDGKVKVYATFGELKTETLEITVSSSALPTLLSSSRIEGAGIEIYVSKEIVPVTPAKEDVTLSGKLETSDDAYKSYKSDNLALTIVETNDQDDKSRIFFTQPAGFPNGLDITETFEITWEGVTINAVFHGNLLQTSSILVE